MPSYTFGVPVEKLETEFLGCGSNSCYLEKPKGIGTNGGCSCFDEMSNSTRIKVLKTLFSLRTQIEILQEQEEKIKESHPEIFI